MPSSLMRNWPRRRWAPSRRALLVVGALALPLLIVLGCQTDLARRSARPVIDVYPAAPQPPRVIALGTLRGAPPPTQREIQLAQFFFGTEPPPQLALAQPTRLSANGNELLICDETLQAVFRWRVGTYGVEDTRIGERVTRPIGVDVTPSGDQLVCSRTEVVRLAPAGNVLTRYALTSGEGFSPACAIVVGEHVWIANLAESRIEIFDLTSGHHVKSIGARGVADGQFALPRSLALMPNGNVGVVDMLNNRVQVLSPDGQPVRVIGGPGDTDGRFGRPKEIAVGPDGAIFVTDAFSQRVHVFDADGNPLISFGAPGSGMGELMLPNGVAIMQAPPPTGRHLPEGETAKYYVLVSEQLENPGVRVYAWLGDAPAEPVFVAADDTMTNGRAPTRTYSAINPHWRPDRCDSCHTVVNGSPQPIAPRETDALCVSCHDGTRAPADPHPIGRPANTKQVNTPEDWPKVDGTISCLTCHDIQRHCSPTAQRPATNPNVLRGYDPLRPLEYCNRCHSADVGGRFSPHRQRDEQGRIRDDACLFCHTQIPEVPEDGRRRFVPHLRAESSAICLNCHSPHWDMSPKGHVDRPVTPRIREWMLIQDLAREVDAPLDKLKELAKESDREPAHIPLGEGKVTCYTCHNPHYAGLFPRDSELGTLAENPADRAAALRTDWIDLCSECHHR